MILLGASQNYAYLTIPLCVSLYDPNTTGVLFVHNVGAELAGHLAAGTTPPGATGACPRPVVAHTSGATSIAGTGYAPAGSSTGIESGLT